MKSSKNNNKILIYGKHTCFSALQNPHRKCHELYVTSSFSLKNKDFIAEVKNNKALVIQEVSLEKLNSISPNNANHQGIALFVSKQEFDMTDILALNQNNENATFIILDQITDIHNVGSIIRTAACFNAEAVILTHNNSPTENSAMARISSGAIDLVPVVHVVNLVQTIKLLKNQDYWCYGLDCESNQSINTVKNFHGKKVVIFGSEEKGLRRLTKENCDILIKIPISKKINSLNVANAAAITLFHIFNSDQSSS